MWICPVCKNEEEDEKAFCRSCGFDRTADCESLPTFGAIGTGRASIAGRQAQLAREKQAEEEKRRAQEAAQQEADRKAQQDDAYRMAQEKIRAEAERRSAERAAAADAKVKLTFDRMDTSAAAEFEAIAEEAERTAREAEKTAKQAEAEKLARQKALSDEMRKQAEERARKTAGAANTAGNSAGSYSAGAYTDAYTAPEDRSAEANAGIFKQMFSGGALPKLISAIIILAAAAGYFYALTDAVMFGSIGVLAVAASLVLWLLGGFRMKAKKKLFTAQTVLAAIVGIAVADFDIMVLAFLLLAVWQFITFRADKKARGK